MQEYSIEIEYHQVNLGSDRRPRITGSDPNFQRAIAKALKTFMDGKNYYNRTFSNGDMAELLGVDAGAMSRYLNCKMLIGSEVLVRALMLGVVVEYWDRQIRAHAEVAQIQLVFEDGATLDADQSRGLAVRIPRKEPLRERTIIQVKAVG